jgi:hypothetical protein
VRPPDPAPDLEVVSGDAGPAGVTSALAALLLALGASEGDAGGPAVERAAGPES